MWKKIVVFFLILNCMFIHVSAVDLTLASHAASCILMEEGTKQILYKRNETEKMYPASTTKIMTMILMFEALHKGSLKWDDLLTCSAYAASMGGSQIYLEEGEKMSVKDLFKAISIASANDACVMMGERIAGSNDNFVKMMNEKAKKLNLINTHFVNPTGLHDENHYTCALDLATMAAYLIKIGKDELFATTSLYDSYIRENSAQKFWLVNTNKLLKSYEGVDGLKTGYTKEAGYCIVSTAKKDGLRLIAVVMKEELPKVRNQEVCQLLDYGYSLYENRILFKKGEVIETKEIKNAKVKKVDIVPLSDVTYIQDKSHSSNINYVINYTSFNAPVKKGEVIGHLLIVKDGENIASFDISVKEDVEALTFIEKISLYVKDMF